MSEAALLPVKEQKVFPFPHFPNRMYAAIFRLWETVRAERIAAGLQLPLKTVLDAAAAMGLPEQQNMEHWPERGYITTIRNAWHILPYDQLLGVLDWTEERLALALKEDDFLYCKLGDFKPDCPRICEEPLLPEQEAQLALIRQTVKSQFSDMFTGAKPFDFYSGDTDDVLPVDRADGFRTIYSYCGLYGDVLDKDISISYPESLLKKYQQVGINAIWLPAVLYQLTPFGLDESYSEGWEVRQERLRELIAVAGKYGIQVILYLNEPRAMPLKFFEKYPEMQGRTMDLFASMCLSDSRVLENLKTSVRSLCQSVPGIGGFFMITISENLTHCKSREEGTECLKCKDIPINKMVSDVICAVSEASRSVDPKIRTIAWTWSWDTFMTAQELKACIDALPKEVILQSNSEARKKYNIGGIEGEVQDYSISIPGPGELAKSIWDYARKKGHDVCAKVQVNVTWECSTLPFLPVFDLVREHMTALRETGVKHVMLSWTLGGYPSVNLKVATQCLSDPSEEKYDALLEQEFGEYAPLVKKTTKIFSDAFRHFPFHIISVYMGPQNAGPSNLLYEKPSGFDATMTCYSYDDLDRWRADYPRDIYREQLKKLSDGWRVGLQELEYMPDCLYKQAALGGYLLFYSSYLQADFVMCRDAGNHKRILEILKEERKLALDMYQLMRKCSLFGYEAANHYYFNKGMLMEKVLNCDYLSRYFSQL